MYKNILKFCFHSILILFYIEFFQVYIELRPYKALCQDVFLIFLITVLLLSIYGGYWSLRQSEDSDLPRLAIVFGGFIGACISYLKDYFKFRSYKGMIGDFLLIFVIILYFYSLYRWSQALAAILSAMLNRLIGKK